MGCTGPMFGSNERHQSNKHRSMALRGRALFLAKRRTGSEHATGGCSTSFVTRSSEAVRYSKLSVSA